MNVTNSQILDKLTKQISDGAVEEGNSLDRTFFRGQTPTGRLGLLVEGVNEELEGGDRELLQIGLIQLASWCLFWASNLEGEEEQP